MSLLTDEQRQERWQHILEEQKQSGLTKVDFCRQQSIPQHRFYYWQRKFNKSAEISSGFAQVEVMDLQDHSGICISLPDGLKELSCDFNAAALQRFLAVVSSKDALHVTLTL